MPVDQSMATLANGALKDLSDQRVTNTVRMANNTPHTRVPGRHRHLVEQDRADDDPGDGEETVEEAVHGRCQRHAHRHAVRKNRHQQGQRHRDGARGVTLYAPDGQRKKEKDDGYRRAR
jgi:hypothetical protein